MRIRLAQPTDAAALARIHVDTWRTTYTGIVPDAHLASLSYEARAKRWEETLGAKDSSVFVFVAEDDDGQVVGFAVGGPERSGDPIYTGELYGIYLLKDYQRKGMGRQLVAAVVHRLLQMGYPSMLIWVLAQNPSRKFYAALGGQPVREQKIVIGGATLLEVAYGWQDIRPLAQTERSS
jgi:GNAT superfamily N-acetyltransferase